jgi:hypothetical protein
MTRRARKFFVLGTLLVAVTAGIITHRLIRKPVYMETAKGRYRVISARYVHGTNITFSAEFPWVLWGRKLLDRVGIHLAGSRPGSPFARGMGIHTIAILCDGRVPDEDLTLIEAECKTESGQTVRLNHRMKLAGSGSRVCILFYYADYDIPLLRLMGMADSEVDDFSPRQLRIMRAADRKELSILNLSH